MDRITNSTVLRRLEPLGFRPVTTLAILMFFLGLLVTAAGYLEFYAGDWLNTQVYSGRSGIWNYPNAGAGIGLMAFGILLWVSALLLLARANWNESSQPTRAPVGPPFQRPMLGTGGPGAPPPPVPPTVYLPPPPPPPGPPPYPPGPA